MILDNRARIGGREIMWVVFGVTVTIFVVGFVLTAVLNDPIWGL